MGALVYGRRWAEEVVTSHRYSKGSDAVTQSAASARRHVTFCLAAAFGRPRGEGGVSLSHTKCPNDESHSRKRLHQFGGGFHSLITLLLLVFYLFMFFQLLMI